MGAAPEPPAGLAERIVLRIETERRRRRARRAGAFGAALAGSFSLIAYGWSETAAEAAHSGFFVFLSLLLFNFSAAAAHLSDFLLSAVESLPAFAIALFFTGVLFALWSAAKFLREIFLLRHPMRG